MQAPSQRSQTADPVTVLKLFIVGSILLLLIKLWLASVLDLYSDEVFYWLASANPALAYSDLPFMTSLLVGLGSSLDPGNPFAVRILFLLMGSSLPLLVYWLSRGMTDRQQALESAALTLCLPLGGFLGLLAVPDVPLLCFVILSIGFFERSLRSNRLTYWIATGIFVALGLSTHYRFFLYPAAAVLFLILFKAEQKQWTNPRFWLAIAIASIGLTPILWFNLNNELSSASFYFVDRHPWQFQAGGLLHIFKQAGLVTPPLYGLFALTVWRAYLDARNGNRNAALLLSFSLLNIAVYLVLAPWTDATSTSIHWPLSGYFPLLVLLPSSLRFLYNYCSQRWNPRVALKINRLIPALGFVGSLVALLGVGSQAYQLPLQALVGSGVLSNKMAGWREFSEFTEDLIAREFGGDVPVIVTDNYYTAAQAEFLQLTTNSITLDKDKAVRDGRITQYQLWEKDESGLRKLAGHNVLFINEDSTLTTPDKHDSLLTMCSHIDALEFTAELSLFNGDKRFSYYRGSNLLGIASGESNRATPCPFPARAWIDTPAPDSALSGNAIINGWAYNEDVGIESVQILIDGEAVARADYGVQRDDVVDAMGVTSDPQRPNLGYGTTLDTSTLSNGSHLLELLITNRQGTVSRYGERRIVVEN